MIDSVAAPWSEVPRFTFTAAIDILCVAFLIYQFILIVRGRRAVPILLGLCIVGAVYAVALYARLELLRTILATLAPYTGFVLIVVFQNEIRRILARLGRAGFTGFREFERREVADEILLALGQLSQRKTGALIVVEGRSGLRTFTESGVAIDGRVSRDLLCAIFHPGAALHDGAVIVQGSRITAAACFLPLTTNPTLLRNLGTRHRAAIGITEESDALSLVVSEETGLISAALHGDIETGISLQRAGQYLAGKAKPREDGAAAAAVLPAPESRS